MAGTRAGGVKAAMKNKERDPDFFKRIGAIGGRASNTGGFKKGSELARAAGRKGGTMSKRNRDRERMERGL